MTRLDPPEAGSVSAALPPVAPDATQDGDSEVVGYFIGECGHPTLLVGPVFWIGPCEDCDTSAI